MAAMAGTSFMNIPPPPLPEFYASERQQQQQQQQRRKQTSSTTSTEGDVEAVEMTSAIFAGDGAYDGKARPNIRSSPYPMPLMAMPPLNYGPNGTNVPPLAIYHICRLCLRTRSARYHREHPIPIDGLPPPPGICRRCRVTSVEETRKVADIVVESRSNEIKLGCIAPFVPEDAIISNKEMRNMKADKSVGRVSEDKLDKSRSTGDTAPRRQDIVYRHVKVVHDEDDMAPMRSTKVTFTSEEDVVDSSDDEEPPSRDAARPEAMKFRRESSRKSTKATTSMQVQPTESPASEAKSVRSTVLQKMDSSKASISTRHSASGSGPGTILAAKISEAAVKPSPPVRTDEDIREIARDEVRRYHQETLCPERGADSMRQIARDEIARYRRAERKIEAHPDPYAHGKMVPVDRRIELERDVATPKAWEAPPKKAEKAKLSAPPSKPLPSHPLSRGPAADQSVRSSSYLSTSSSSKHGSDGNDDPTETHDRSRGPRLRRELSVERRCPEGGEVESTKVATTRDVKKQGSKSKSVQLREVFDTVQESDPPRWSSRAEPYVIELRRRRPERMDNIVEVIEEVEIPARTTKKPAPTPETDPPTGFQAWWTDSQPRDGSKDVRINDERSNAPRVSVRPPESQQPRSRTRHSELSKDDDDWRGPTVKTVDSRSTRFYETSGSGGTRQGTARASIRQSGRSSQHRDGADRERDVLAIGTAGTSSAMSEGASRKSLPADTRRKEPLLCPEVDESFEKIVRPTDTPSVRSEVAKSASRQSASGDESEYTYTKRTFRPAKSATGQIEKEAPPVTTSSRDDGTEYTYTKRVVRPADCPPWTQAASHDVSARRVEVEEWVETKRYSPWDLEAQQRDLREIQHQLQQEAREAEQIPIPMPMPSHNRPPSRPASSWRSAQSGYEGSSSRRTTEGDKGPLRSSKGYEKEAASSDQHKTTKNNPPRPKFGIEGYSGTQARPGGEDSPAARRQRRHNERMGEGEDPNRVHFSKKVDVTPTPPDSDDSSSAFRSYHSVGRRSGQQVDGGSSPEGGEMHLVGEFETRGRMHSRDSSRRHYERESVHDHEREGKKSIKYSHVREVDKPKGIDTGSLDRALSESPSREWLPPRQDEEKYDGGGPYRVVERMSGSMRVEDGRRVGGPEKQPERSAHGHGRDA